MYDDDEEITYYVTGEEVCAVGRWCFLLLVFFWRSFQPSYEMASAFEQGTGRKVRIPVYTANHINERFFLGELIPHTIIPGTWYLIPVVSPGRGVGNFDAYKV